MHLLSEVLLIYGLEHPDYEYQQGFNDLVAVLYTNLLSDVVFYIEDMLVSGEDWDLYLNIHNPYRVQSELYYLFKALMDLGVKDLYSRIDT